MASSPARAAWLAAWTPWAESSAFAVADGVLLAGARIYVFHPAGEAAAVFQAAFRVPDGGFTRPSCG